MNTQFNNEMLVLARESRGLVQKELASQLSIDQGTLSKIENGVLHISEEQLEEVCRVLEYPKSFFLQTGNLFHPNLHYYRKKVTIPGKVLKKAEAQMNITKLTLDKLLNSVDLATQNLVKWDVELNGSPTKAAQYLREYWRVPKGRIDNLVKLVEDNGVIVVILDLESEKLDGLSLFTEDNHPIVFVNSRMSGERQRLTLAHELGHIVLHFGNQISEGRDIEDEAFEFAAELLMPQKEIISQLSRLDLLSLITLKKYWKVSMRALALRAKKLKAITDYQYRYLVIKMNKEWGAKNEPHKLEVERPGLIREIINLHTESLGYAKEELASFLSLTYNEFMSKYFDERVKLKIIRS